MSQHLGGCYSLDNFEINWKYAPQRIGDQPCCDATAGFALRVLDDGVVQVRPGARMSRTLGRVLLFGAPKEQVPEIASSLEAINLQHVKRRYQEQGNHGRKHNAKA